MSLWIENLFLLAPLRDHVLAAVHSYSTVHFPQTFTVQTSWKSLCSLHKHRTKRKWIERKEFIFLSIMLCSISKVLMLILHQMQYIWLLSLALTHFLSNQFLIIVHFLREFMATSTAVPWLLNKPTEIGGKLSEDADRLNWWAALGASFLTFSIQLVKITYAVLLAVTSCNKKHLNEVTAYSQCNRTKRLNWLKPWRPVGPALTLAEGMEFGGWVEQNR